LTGHGGRDERLDSRKRSDRTEQDDIAAAGFCNQPRGIAGAMHALASEQSDHDDGIGDTLDCFVKRRRLVEQGDPGGAETATPPQLSSQSFGGGS
jgi:hypothetical protein